MIRGGRRPKDRPAPKTEFPLGWDEERVQRVLTHYETQAEAEALAEDETRRPAPCDDVQGE